MNLALFVLLLAEPPGLAVATTEPQAAQPTGVLKVEPGRFVPLNQNSGKPTLLLGNEAGLFTLYPIAKGEAVFGVRYDEPAGAKTKRYTFPSGATHIAVAGDTSGVASLTAVENGKTAQDPPVVVGQMVLEVVGPRPPPDPKPDPKPDPNPEPVVGKLHAAIVIEPSGTVMPNRAALILAADQWCAENDVKRRWVYDNVVDSTGKPPVDLVPWLNRTKGKALPAVYLVTDKGGILFEGTLPTKSAAEMTTLFNQYKGK